MEYRLNKIDTDARRKMIEKTRSGKIHGSEKLQKAKSAKKEDVKKEAIKKQNKEIKKQYITINGEKIENENLEINGELELTLENSVGAILDKKG